MVRNLPLLPWQLLSLLSVPLCRRLGERRQAANVAEASERAAAAVHAASTADRGKGSHPLTTPPHLSALPRFARRPSVAHGADAQRGCEEALRQGERRGAHPPGERLWIAQHSTTVISSLRSALSVRSCCCAAPLLRGARCTKGADWSAVAAAAACCSSSAAAGDAREGQGADGRGGGGGAGGHVQGEEGARCGAARP